MKFKLFVDGTRDFPTGFKCAKHYDECINLYLIYGEFEFVDLDYSLGEEHTGMDILIWMKENKKKPKHINIHSNNEKGRKLMQEFAIKNFPNSRITMNIIYN